jgi:hypothetical protein
MPTKTTPKAESKTRGAKAIALERDHIREGLRQAESGNFVPDAQATRILKRLRRK